MPRFYACANCGEAILGGGRCADCKRAANQQKRERPNWSNVYNTRRWRILSKHVLERDDYQCQTCGEPATNAGHTHPFDGADDPQAWDETNITAVCTRCNGREAATRQAVTG